MGERLATEGTNKLYLGGDNSIDSCLVGWRLGLCVGEYCRRMWWCPNIIGDHCTSRLRLGGARSGGRDISSFNRVIIHIYVFYGW